MSGLSTYHVQQMDRVSSDFFEDGDGLRTVAKRTTVVDDIVRGHFEEIFGDAADGIAAVAVGGYGRSELFPHSDVDLLLLFRRSRDLGQHRDRISTLLTALWDSKLRLSHSVRDQSECARLAPDNTELHISLLDTRYLAGDAGFFENFQTSTLPRFYLREQKSLIRSLGETARKRHHKFESTLYHLEPDIKEGPGGLRDYHLACWTAQLENMQPGRVPTSEEFLPKQQDWSIDDAKRFLFGARCFLHYYYGRDKNSLSYDMQDSIANAGAGKLYDGADDVAGMMRMFYRHTRRVYRLALRLMDESAAPSSALLSIIRNRKSRLSNRDFTVSRGAIYFRDSRALAIQPDLAMRIFEFQARHGLPLAAQTEQRIREHLPEIREHFGTAADHWTGFREILLLPHTYRALEAMREAGVLYILFPEFELVDCLVIRDFYHRYTVDEHTLMAIRILKELDQAAAAVDQKFARLLKEVDQPELLSFALLFHDIGKAVKGRPHSEESADLADQAMQRIGLADRQSRETVLFLVRDHLVMSEVMTKSDLTESAVLERFEEQVGTVERLKLLTLLTYADSIAVNPAGVTSWRKDLLWRLYSRADKLFQRDHEDRRIHPGPETACLQLAADEDESERMREFLEGFPQRYLLTHQAEEVYRHFQMAQGLPRGEARVDSVRADGRLDAVVVAWDRPFLFASLCAAIASFGINIEHAEAFANEAGEVLDSFRVSIYPASELPDLEHFNQVLRRVADGSLDADRLGEPDMLMRRRRDRISAHVSFDNDTSARATIFYVQASDRYRLLYDLATVFSRHECEIDVVLSHTQGQRAMDAFYLRRAGAKLPQELCEELREDLEKACTA